jgi:hypothetical protein
MFKLDLGFPMAGCYLGHVTYNGIKRSRRFSAKDVKTYVPVAVIFCNTQISTSTAGAQRNETMGTKRKGEGTQGHFWVECKMPVNFGNSLVNRYDAVTINVNEVDTKVVNVPEQHVWVHYDNLQDSGSSNWELLVDGARDPDMLPVYGGNSENSPRDSTEYANYLPMGASPRRAQMIKETMVSLGSIVDGATNLKTNELQKYKLVKSEDTGEWYLVFYNKVRIMPQVDSIIYARVK